MRWVHFLNVFLFLAGPEGQRPLLVLTRGVHYISKKVNRAIMETQTTAATDAWTMYIYSLKSPVSKQKYPQRLAKFFAFADLPQDIPIEEQNNTII
jgi:hypothetical protein